MTSAQSLEESGSAAGTEDALLVHAPMFGVFDGATSLTQRADESRPRGGAIAASLARDVFAGGGSRPLLELALEANVRIAAAMDAAKVDRSRRESLWGTTAAVVRIDADAVNWLSIGDSVIVLLFDDGTFRPVVPLHDHDRTTKRLLARLGGPVSTRRARIHDELVAVRRRANVEYGVLNGDAAASAFMMHGRHSIDGLRHVLLFTDGLLVPRADPDGDDDLEPIVSSFVAQGLTGAKDLVRRIEDGDLECVAYPRLKPHDDIAAIAVTFSDHPIDNIRPRG